ncbi:hypothetical protein AB6A40_005280 [Gnathostoma spinigerum]|uniref:UBC core domain-containing protein n=1 Tax=Gnathostoma spinigerum TaxID=75299 RepID=A0ABD6EH80_9BILA
MTTKSNQSDTASCKSDDPTIPLICEIATDAMPAEPLKLSDDAIKEHLISSEFALICRDPIDGIYVMPSAASLTKWFGILFVRRGVYAGAMLRFTIYLPQHFPFTSELPTVFFDLDVHHPNIHADTHELDMTRYFPSGWKEEKHHLYHVLLIVQRTFFSFDADPITCANPEMADLLHHNKEQYKKLIHDVIKESRSTIYDPPRTSDINAIRFSPWDASIHEALRQRLIGGLTESQISTVSNSDCIYDGGRYGTIFKSLPKTGYSWLNPSELIYMKEDARPPELELKDNNHNEDNGTCSASSSDAHLNREHDALSGSLRLDLESLDSSVRQSAEGELASTDRTSSKFDQARQDLYAIEAEFSENVAVDTSHKFEEAENAAKQSSLFFADSAEKRKNVGCFEGNKKDNEVVEKAGRNYSGQLFGDESFMPQQNIHTVSSNDYLLVDEVQLDKTVLFQNSNGEKDINANPFSVHEDEEIVNEDLEEQPQNDEGSTLHGQMAQENARKNKVVDSVTGKHRVNEATDRDEMSSSALLSLSSSGISGVEESNNDITTDGFVVVGAESIEKGRENLEETRCTDNFDHQSLQYSASNNEMAKLRVRVDDLSNDNFLIDRKDSNEMPAVTRNKKESHFSETNSGQAAHIIAHGGFDEPKESQISSSKKGDIHSKVVDLQNFSIDESRGDSRIHFHLEGDLGSTEI